MNEVSKGLFIGRDKDCFALDRGNCQWGVVHACCWPCFYDKVGGKKEESKLPSFVEYGLDLYLNLEDIANLEKSFLFSLILKSTSFICRAHCQGLNILVHCNFGQSRSASLGLVYLAFIREITRRDFSSSHREFNHRYSRYRPSLGLLNFFKNYWDQLFLFLDENIEIKGL